MRLSTLFGPGNILCGLNVSDPDQVIDHLVRLSAATGARLDVEGIAASLSASKRCGLSLLGPHVAVLHAGVLGVDTPRIAMAFAPVGREWRWPPEITAAVRLFVLILTPRKEPAAYLRANLALACVLRKPEFLERLWTLNDADAVWRHFQVHDEPLHEYVMAGDMMQTSFPTLRDTDTLRAAIDSFCQFNVVEVPVVDADGDLVGVVGVDELIRICLPDYITWMEDLTPILQFQPFGEVLDREADMPLLEIMKLADGYATVEEAAPAVQVAKVMMRRGVRQVLVVRGSRLVGIISSGDFVRVILRS
jgi:CBS domain-containing protein/mannitol/fructose-specific phosphotransferase system IIA component (Ntr-type)